MPERTKAKTKKPDVKKENNDSQTKKPNNFQSGNSPADQIIQLQRTVGNQAVQRLIKSGALQAKLKIGQPNDIYEQEADRVAEQVIRMPEPKVQRQAEEEEELQMKAGPNTLKNLTLGDKEKVSSLLESSIQSMRSGGRTLNKQERSFFEPRMGMDFSSVRLHFEPEAAKTATEIGARAFTVGNHITVAEDEYNFHSPQGKQLMAHELAHVVQNGGEETVQRLALPAMGAATKKWLAAAVQGLKVSAETVKSSSGADITWDLEKAGGVLLPGGRMDVMEYQRENPNITLERKELQVSFWRGTQNRKKAGITFGLSFTTDGKGIGDISPRLITTHDWVGWGAHCTMKLMPLKFVGKNGKAIIQVTLTNSWVKNVFGIDIADGVDSGIWKLEGDGSFSFVRKDRKLWETHSLKTIYKL